MCVCVLFLTLVSVGCELREQGAGFFPSPSGLHSSAATGDAFLAFAWARASACGADDFTPCEVSIAGRCGVRVLPETRTANCGGPVLGPWAQGSVALVETGNGKVWRLEGKAVDSTESSSGSAEAQVTVVDTFALDPGTSGLGLGDPAPLFLKIKVQGEITGAAEGGGTFYLADAVLRRIRSDGRQVPYFGKTVVFQRANTQPQDEVVTLALPAGAVIGDKILMTATFVHAAADPAVPGTPATSRIAAEYSLCSDAGVLALGDSGAKGDCGGGEVTLLDVDTVQGVSRPSRLVANRDGVVKVDILHTYSSPTPATVRLTFEQSGVSPARTIEQSIMLPVGDGDCRLKSWYFPAPVLGNEPDSCETSNAGSSLADLGFEPVPGPDYRVSVEVVPSTADSEPSDNSLEVVRPVAETSLRIGYVKLLAPLNPGAYASIPDGEFEEASRWSDAHVKAMLPVRTDDHPVPICATTLGNECDFVGNLARCKPTAHGANWSTCEGIREDGAAAYRLAKKWDPFLDAAVLLVPGGYFSYHGLHTSKTDDPAELLGISPLVEDYVISVTGGPSAGRSDSHLPVVPHELLHELFDHTVHANGFPDGYWVGCQHDVPGVDCLVPDDALDLRTASISGLEPPSVWITGADYDAVLARLKLQVDPPVLVITGSITRPGTVQITGMLELPVGSISRERPGHEYSIELVGENGVLAVFEGPVKFGDEFPLDPEFSGMTLTIPYPFETTKIRFKKGRDVIFEMDPLSGTLRDVVSRVPDRGFAKNPEQRRRALLNKIHAFEKSLADGGGRGALEKLDQDIRKHIREWLVDFVNERNGIEFDRSDVLTQIDRVEARLRVQIED